ncbi:beta-ketoacyl-[acyl-carrier-protein] synthase II [bacterium]|nr:MAG: beta-ketoacyl-[acyl-carrier-protein] synthase II [bacterium]
MSRRVVVTGLGMVTALGHNACQTWDGLVSGRSGTGRITLFDPDGFESQVAAEVKEFDPSAYMDRKEARRADRVTQFTFVAANEALRQSGYEIPEQGGHNFAIVIGTAIGGITTLSAEFETMRQRGPSRVSPFLMPMMLADMSSAANIIRRGDAEIALAGGTEAPITPICIAGFGAAKALTANNAEPTRASRPFDATRDGFILGEGAGVLLLESEEHARGRGATVLAELAGYGATSDAFHITQPDENGEGAARAMARAMAQAGIEPREIGYLNAHGTSTPMNDKLETVAIKRAFGDHAKRVAISSTKSALGHLLGAAGAVEAAISIMAMQHGVLPPTVNYETPDPECDLDYIPNIARKAEVDAVMTNSLGFGGHNASLVFRRYRPD